MNRYVGQISRSDRIDQSWGRAFRARPRLGAGSMRNLRCPTDQTDRGWIPSEVRRNIRAGDARPYDRP
jgi:hypothetical protein